jgi:two-component system cell cycle response regulator
VAGKILIVDDVSTNRIVLKVKLAAAFYETIQAGSGADALRLTRELRPDLVLLDLVLPDMDGVEVCARLKSDPLTHAIPVVILTAARDEPARLRALDAGAEDIFWKPYSDVVLFARLRSVLRARDAEMELGLRHQTYRELGFAEQGRGFAGQATIGVVAPTRQTGLKLIHDLSPHSSDRLVLLDPTEALRWDDDVPAPDVFIIPANLDGPGDGLRLMAELRSRPATRFSAVCILVPGPGTDTAVTALDMGANDLIEATASPRETALRLRIQITRKRRSDRLRASVEDGLRLAMTDPLTGLHNRRYAFPHLARIAASAAQAGRQFAVMVLDIDRFKEVNDTWGHAAGDTVLVEVAERLKRNLRAVDLIARTGGEEFLVALPDTSIEAARRTAERLRHVVEAQPVAHASGGMIRITVSIGLAMGSGETTCPTEIERLVDSADRALLGSKAEGRNLVTVAQSAA